MDCITEKGDVSIAYTGSVRWGLFHLHYSSLLESSAKRIRTSYSLRQQPEPAVEGALLSWRSKPLNMDGEWQSDSLALRQTIYASSDGDINWNCLMPRANSRFQHRSGLGYAEHLTMTIPPWKLPIRTLRWGRFCSTSASIVWIDWEGEFSTCLVYRDGKAISASVLADDRMEFNDGSALLLDRSLVIREGPLGSTALSVIPGLKNTVPARLLQVDECKWRSRARLEKPGSSPIEGWAIHERVTWPK